MLHPTNVTRLTFANVVSVFALFIALGGGAYAVSTAGKNSVVSKSIKNGQVKNKDLAANAVDGAKVADSSLTGEDVDESTLGPVPSAAGAEHANSADTATNADSATNATTAINATNADSATNANHATSADSATTAANGARAFDFDHAANDPTPVTILTIGELTLRAQCTLLPPTAVDLSIVSTTSAEVSYGFLEELDQTGSISRTASFNLSPNSPESIAQNSANGAGATSNRRAEGQFVYRSANRIVTATFHANARYSAGNPMNNRCQVRGTALTAAP